MHAPRVYCGSPWRTCFDTDEEYAAMRDSTGDDVRRLDKAVSLLKAM